MKLPGKCGKQWETQKLNNFATNPPSQGGEGCPALNQLQY